MSELFLGRLAYEPKPHTRLDPVALHDNGRWKIYSDWTSALPSEGKVFAPNLTGFLKDELLTFGVEPNMRIGKGPDKFLLTSCGRTREVLDFRTAGAEAARRQLVEEGLPSVWANSGVVAAIGDGICVVLTLQRDPVKGLFVADMVGLERLQTYQFDDRLFQGQRIGNRWIDIPGVTVGRPNGQVNWSRDVDFLDTVLKRLRKATPNGPGSVSRAQIPHLISYLSKAELLPSMGGDLSPMLERLKRLSVDLVANSQALTDLVATVAAFDPVERRLKIELEERRVALQQEFRAELEVSVRDELRRDMEHLEAARDALKVEVSALASSADHLRNDAREHEAAAQKARAVIVDEITTVLRSFGDFPPEAEPSVEAISARLSAVLGHRGSSIRELARPSAPWANPKLETAPRADWKNIGSALKSVAECTGYDVQDVLLADIGARAGDIVVLPEEHGGLALAYSKAVAGGNLARHTLDPSVLNVDDLWKRPGSDKATAFSKAWSAAHFDHSRFSVVLLDGLSRTPLDLWMPSLVDILNADGRPSNLLVFATLGQSFIDAGRIWKRLDRMVTAVNPTIRSSGTAFLADVMERRTEKFCFDPTTALQPAKEALLDVIDRGETLNSHQERLRFLRLYRAAWPHGGQLDVLEQAWSIVSAGGNTTRAVQQSTVTGFEWLRSMIEIKP
jgi:hypothetical protein